MSETTEIKPALTAREWRDERKYDPVNGSAVFLDRQADGTVHFVIRSHDTWHGEPYTGAWCLTESRAAAIMALANTVSGPFGFTMADVLNLVALADASDTEGHMLRGVWLRDIASRIVAILPPTSPPV